MHASAQSIGIFWGLSHAGQQHLLADLVPLEAGEPYGDFLTYGGHYEHWQRLAAKGVAALRQLGLSTAPVWSEYEEWPRGRVVHHLPTRRSIVYADRQLQRPAWLELIVQRFGLSEGSFDLRSDPHYVSTRRLELIKGVPPSR